MLLLTQTHGNTDFEGTGIPFNQDKSPGTPSTKTLYSRDWTSSGLGLLPKKDDQFMIMRSNGDFITMTVTKWCAGATWLSLGNECGTSDHPGFAMGPVTTSTGSLTNQLMYFNACAVNGQCGLGGGDGVGFSTHSGWPQFDKNCFGGCWNGASFGGASLYWEGNVLQEVLSYYYRPSTPT